MRLEREFFERNTILVARDLLGKNLVLDRGDVVYKGKIVETEAYINNNDKAAHFHKGLTERTKVVNDPGGHIYIYNIYGMYQLFNIVSEKSTVHGAVLIRAVQPIEGIEQMFFNRYKRDYDNKDKKSILNLTNGPAKFVMAFGISKEEFYGVDITKDNRISVEYQEEIQSKDIIKTKRINVDYAEHSKDYLLRYYIKDNPYISRK